MCVDLVILTKIQIPSKKIKLEMITPILQVRMQSSRDVK